MTVHAEQQMPDFVRQRVAEDHSSRAAEFHRQALDAVIEHKRYGGRRAILRELRKA